MHYMLPQFYETVHTSCLPSEHGHVCYICIMYLNFLLLALDIYTAKSNIYLYLSVAFRNVVDLVDMLEIGKSKMAPVFGLATAASH